MASARRPVRDIAWPKSGVAGLAAPFVRRRVRELAGSAQVRAHPVAGELAAPGLSGEALAGCAARVVARAKRLASTV